MAGRIGKDGCMDSFLTRLGTSHHFRIQCYGESMNQLPLYGLLLSVLTLTSCKSSQQTQELDLLIDEMIAAQGLDGDPLDGAIPPDVSSSLADLGKRLFFSKSLGGNQTAACATCHHPVLGGGDGLVLPIGVDAVDEALLGPGRTHLASAEGFDGGPTVPRNSPTTFNVFLWQEALFWDGRVEAVPGGFTTPDMTYPAADPLAGPTLTDAQARFPVTSAEEMRGFHFEAGNDNTAVRDHLAARIGGIGIGAGEIVENWLPLFQDAFASPGGTAADLITFPNIVRAIAEYENSQVFVDNPWSAYVGGDEDAITEAAKRGALLFFNEPEDGGAACVRCHSGDFFTDERFHAVGFPQIGRGKGDLGSLGDTHGDHGRERVTGDSADRFSFRTPSLLNVEATGPWGHAGAFLTLEETVRYHLDPDTGWAQFNFGAMPAGIQIEGCFENTGDALLTVASRQLAGTSLLPRIPGVADAQIQDLVAFLRALTDPRVLDPAALEPWIARNDLVFTDSQLLDAHDEDANGL